jgi:PAS domain S-box-containing protein
MKPVVEESHMGRRWCVRILFPLLLLLFLFPVGARGEGGRVLLICSYHPSFPTFYQQIRGLGSVLDPAGVSFDVEFMDTKRFSVDEANRHFLEQMRFKLGKLPAYDVIVTADDAALHFVLAYRLELFPGKPVVFLGVNDQKLARELDGEPLFTGVIESVSMRGTLEDIRRLLPRVGAVHAVVDAQPGGQGDLKTFLGLKNEFPGLRLDALSLKDMTWEEFGKKLAALPANDAVLLLSAYADRTARARSFEDGLRFILGHTRLPVFHLWEHGLGRGLVGGKIISHEEQGRIAGGLVLRILAGAPAGSLPVVDGDDANRHDYDYQALVRLGLDPFRLPEGSVFRGRPVSVFSLYGNEIFFAAVFVCVLLILSAALMSHVVRLRRAKAAIKESETRYKALFDANADGILVVETDSGKFLYANPAAGEMFGCPTGDFHKLGIADIHPPDLLNEIFHVFGRQAGKEMDIAESVPCLRRDGTVFWADVRSFLLEIDSRPCLAGLFRDVTERIQAMEAVLQARDAAEEANRSKSMFLANMSHEIRTPLNGIAGMLQLLEHSNPSSEQQEYIRLGLASTMRLSRLLGDILDLSRIEAGRLELQEKPFRLEDVRDATSSLLSITARDKGISLAFDLDLELPRGLAGDQVRLQQILFNLAGNAIKFTESGGVHIQASPLPGGQPDVVRVLFVVSDTGIGISDDQLDSIFRPFVQGEISYVRQFQGAGLGLSIVRRLVSLMGGTLAVENGSEGTVFYVSLPFRRVLDYTPEKEEPTVARDLEPVRKRILLAEDDEANRFTLSLLLRKFGYDVVCVPDGRQAVERLRSEAFDAVLMDIQMPVMDGLEATRVIRADVVLGARAKIPIVAVTASAMNGARERFLEAGMDGYVSKPVDMAVLQDTFERLCMHDRAPASGELA